MAPLIVQLVATLLARIRYDWKDAVRIGMAVLFFFTAGARFSPQIVANLAAMIPPPLTGALWPVYLTGLLEALGAIGLLLPRWRRPAAICLVLLLIAMFPANAYAAIRGVMLNGKPATALLPRTFMQLLWIALLWWSAIRVPLPRAEPAH
ncbi:MAG TPA: DoxX family protein [Thermoanaerobaculia bacterium]|nr:DoxX family protein [Thermoanaerobaculia bacterium]